MEGVGIISPPKQLSSSCFGERMNVIAQAIPDPRPPREMALRKDHEGDAPVVARSYFIRVSKSVRT